MFRKILIANRGEIACRITRTARRLGIATVAVCSEADRNAAHVLDADEAVCIGPAPAAESYLKVAAILDAARQSGAEAIHPGYGFLSENAEFAEAAAAAGIAFIGPRPEHMRAFGLKHEARALAEACGVPLLPGSGLLTDLHAAQEEARRLGFPVMLKSTAGGGGIGLRLCRDEAELAAAVDSVRRLGESNFGHAGMFLERFVERARHIEVQIFGDGKGGVLALGERDCSLQRRNQKVVEETPAPGLSQSKREALAESARRLARHVAYESAGTVEFVYDADRDVFSFLEVNTRLQVEHGVTESVFGIDLVEWMIRQAAGALPPLETFALTPRGAAMEARLYAEDPSKDYRPSAGTLTHVEFPDGIRIDSGVTAGDAVSPYYDPMLAKLIVTGDTREAARAALSRALAETVIHGVATNLDLLRTVANAPFFASGQVHTKALDGLAVSSAHIDVVSPGALTTVQDYPGRLGLWDVGVPPSGPFDSLSFRLVNRVVGNADGAPALECTVTGPKLRFASDTVIALGGAAMEATLDGEGVPFWTPVTVQAGQILALGRITGAGTRTYLAVRHGFDGPLYLGSASTFSLGKFGGHGEGPLKAGDVLRLKRSGAPDAPCPLNPTEAPPLTQDWTIGVLYGPHGAPDFFTDADIATLFEVPYEVHFNSARTGVRLIGPKPTWARHDGGEAGLHPSNIHDNAYAVGTIDFTGDMPIILGPDGPSLGGFVCPATVALAELWKVGQLRPGDRVRFVPLTASEADAHLARQEAFIAERKGPLASPLPRRHSPPEEAALPLPADSGIATVIRQAGDDNLLIEFGPPVLDFKLRFRAHQMLTSLKDAGLPGIIDMTPGIRSLQVHFDSRALARRRLIETIEDIASTLPPVEAAEVESRIVRMPLSWNDPQIQLAVQKYHALVRPDAPWCPSNIEFIRRINGLADEDEVRRIIFEARYLVLGLGDVYLGAPVATPIDPRHRLVTTKYNPARVWTPENAVGIGGAYLCVYGMEGPGGYQLFGRTVQVWSSYQQRGSFEPGTPWLLRQFDQIEFYPVSAEELLEMRDGFRHGRFTLDIVSTRFRLADHVHFLADNAASIEAFRRQQRAAFAEERQRWRASGVSESLEETATPADPADGGALAPGLQPVHSPVAGNVWMINVEAGTSVEADSVLVVLESMKMEIEIRAPAAGIVREIRCERGRPVQAGEMVVVMAEDAA